MRTRVLVSDSCRQEERFEKKRGRVDDLLVRVRTRGRPLINHYSLSGFRHNTPLRHWKVEISEPKVRVGLQPPETDHVSSMENYGVLTYCKPSL